MEKLSYEVLSKKIKDYYINNMHSEFILVDQNDKERRLHQTINYDGTNQTIGSFRIILVDDLTIMNFELINLSNNSKTDNIIISKNLKPIFIMERSEFSRSVIPYQKEKFSIYNEKNELAGQISYEEIRDNLNIKVTNRRNNNGESYSKNYTFYSDNNRVIALKVDDEMHLIIEGGFANGVDSANRFINKVSTKINNKVDSLLGIENIKEYQMSRGKRG